jgi:hypothetical protein
MHHLFAPGFAVQGPFDRFDLAADAADPGEELLLVANGVRHALV